MKSAIIDKRLCAFGLLAILCALVASTPSSAAIQFKLDSFNVTTHAAGSGLLIKTDSSVGSPLLQAFSLDLGQSTTGDLFSIWTDETAWNFDDASPQTASVSFNFSEPAPSFGGGVTGNTLGATIFFASGGVLDWNNGPFVLNFGANGDGQLLVELSDEIFNVGAFTTFTPGMANGATVSATFTLLKIPVQPAPEVQAPVTPEPTTFLVWGGLGLAGYVAGRRYIR